MSRIARIIAFSAVLAALVFRFDTTLLGALHAPRTLSEADQISIVVPYGDFERVGAALDAEGIYSLRLAIAVEPSIPNSSLYIVVSGQNSQATADCLLASGNAGGTKMREVTRADAAYESILDEANSLIMSRTSFVNVRAFQVYPDSWNRRLVLTSSEGIAPPQFSVFGCWSLPTSNTSGVREQFIIPALSVHVVPESGRATENMPTFKACASTQLVLPSETVQDYLEPAPTATGEMFNEISDLLLLHVTLVEGDRWRACREMPAPCPKSTEDHDDCEVHPIISLLPVVGSYRSLYLEDRQNYELVWFGVLAGLVTGLAIEIASTALDFAVSVFRRRPRPSRQADQQAGSRDDSES